MSSAEVDNTEDFLRKIQIFLSAFGWDYLVPAQAILPKPGDQPNVVPPPTLPLELIPVFENLKMILESFPKAKCHQTRIPDFRAKVVDGEGSKGFARLKWAKHWAWLELYRGDKHKVAKLSDIDETLRAAIAKAYKVAQEYLTAARSK